MFTVIYLRRELGHRARQAGLTAIGLAFGVGLVITTIATSRAVSDAQTTVLHTLNGIGTDVTVTAVSTHDKPGNDDAAGSGSNATISMAGGPDAVFTVSELDAIARLAHVSGVSDSLTLNEILPPSKDTGGIPTSVRIDGIDLSHLGRGPYASAALRAGRMLSPAEDAGAAVAVLDDHYAAAHHLDVGSAITLGGRRFTVIGTIGQSTTGAADIYLPLTAAQKLGAPGSASLAGKINTIYVSADSSANVGAIESELATLLPSAKLTSSRELADAVQSSLASATTLADTLSTWLTIGVLLSAIATVTLLTLSSIARRTRELGTLKALGWTSRRIIAQVISESAAVGLAGAAAGVLIGLGCVGIVKAIAPRLTATIDQGGSAHHITVHLTPHGGLAMLIGLALIALIAVLTAGASAAWLTTRLRPADALSAAE